MPLREFAGAAVVAQLTGTLAIGGTSISIDNASGWPTGASAPFVVVIDPETAKEEKALIQSRSGTTLVVAGAGRAYDGTSAFAHNPGAKIAPCIDSIVITEANSHVNNSSLDNHSQYLNNARHDVTARHTFGAAFASPAAPATVAATAAAGVATGPARADHVHALDPALAGNGLAIAGGVLSVGVGTNLEVNADLVRLAATAAGAGLVGGAAAPLSVGQGSGITVNADDVAISADQLFATGDYKYSARTTAQTGWLKCDGSAVSRTGANAALFAELGTAFGAGDGSTTFNLPDLADRMPVGISGTKVRGSTGGAETVVLGAAEMPSHTHTQVSHNHTQNAHDHLAAGSGVILSQAGGILAVGGGLYPLNAAGAFNTGFSTATNNAATATNNNTGGGGAHNNMPPWAAAGHWYIKQ